MQKVYALAFLLAVSVALAAASVDGRWVAKVENRKGTQEIVFNLKTDADRVTGTVAMGKRGRAVEISDGKINGDEISFTTTARGGKKNKQKTTKLVWHGKIAGSEMKGARQAEGARRGQPFTAVRQ